MVVHGFCFPEISFDSGVPQGEFYNAKKCYTMSTTKGKDPYFYSFNGHVVSSVKTNPYLGVPLSEGLSFSAHN